MPIISRVGTFPPAAPLTTLGRSGVVVLPDVVRIPFEGWSCYRWILGSDPCDFEVKGA